MKTMVGRKFEAVNPNPGSFGWYVGGWHKIRLGEKVKLGRKDMGYKVEFIAYGPHKDLDSCYGKQIYCVTEEILKKHFKEVK